jgi:hypothetical protein
VGRERLQELRAAVYDRDGAKVVAVLGAEVPVEVLQLVGDGLGTAIEQKVPGAVTLADRCLVKLHERGWAGDDELAAELEVALGRRLPTPSLEALPVDLEELSALLESGTGERGGVVDRVSGDVWPAPAMDYAEETEEEPPDFDDGDRWLYVGPEGSGEGYRDMEDFIAGISDRVRADQLSIVIDGRGAFRRFMDTIARWPDELERWYRFSDERCRGRAREWLAASGYRAGSPQPKPPSATATGTEVP